MGTEVQPADILTRPHSPNISGILGKKFKVLDDGFVRVVDYMGNDESIVQAARVSYGKGTKKVSEDRSLIRYLMRHQHTTPFEMCELKLHVRVPMDCWRQWIRHRTASINEYSTRYSEAIDACQVTKPDEWRSQTTNNKQGSSGTIPVLLGKHLSNREALFQKDARGIYQERLARGIAREQARKDLPLSTYTEAYWKINLHNLFHFLSLRMDDHAQLEIRSYANVIGTEIVKLWCPLAWDAFLDYRLNALLLSDLEQRIIQHISKGHTINANRVAKTAGWLVGIKEGLWLEIGGEGLKKNREREECESKLEKLGLTIPWK